MRESTATPLHALSGRESTRRLISLLSGRNGFLFQRIEAVDAARVRIDGTWVLNFTSSNYLGLTDDVRVRDRVEEATRTWGISRSAPRILGADTLTLHLERALAILVRREASLVFPSTLHAAIDVVSHLTGTGGRIFIDEDAYPISVSAARLAARGHGRLIRFRHDDTGTLERLLSGSPPAGPAIVVCDGVYPETGMPASLRDIGEVASSSGATVYVDDAHGLGLFGAAPSDGMPYGGGGGGTVLHTGARPGNIAYVSSLSKALGVPLAFAAGSATFVRNLRTASESVIHSSSPALPVVAAALATLRHHAQYGDERRYRLLAGVMHFRSGVAELGLDLTTESAFPVQSIRFPSAERAIATGVALRRRGVWPVIALGSGGQGYTAALRFIITAAHTLADLDEAVEALANTRDRN